MSKVSCPIGGDYTGILPDAPELCAKVMLLLIYRAIKSWKHQSLKSSDVMGLSVVLDSAESKLSAAQDSALSL